jgi:hypothetical protein
VLGLIGVDIGDVPAETGEVPLVVAPTLELFAVVPVPAGDLPDEEFDPKPALPDELQSCPLGQSVF